MTNDLVSAAHEHAATLPSMWAVIPFAGLLLSIGIVSFICANFPHNLLARLWEKNRNKLVVALLWSVPVLILLAGSGMASRGGGFYADQKTGLYHTDKHDEAQPADETNTVIFNTPEEAEKAGYKPCEICNPSGKKGMQ